MRKIFTVTPSFLIKLMKHSSKVKSDVDIFYLYEKFAKNSNQVFTGEDIDDLEQDDKDMDSIPDNLEDLAQALIGALSFTEDDS